MEGMDVGRGRNTAYCHRTGAFCKSNIVISREQALSYILALGFTSFILIVFRSPVRMENGPLSLPSRSKHAYFSTPFNQNLFLSLLIFYKADLNSFVHQ